MLDCFRQILGRNVKLLGIPTYTTFGTIFLFHQSYKIGKYGFSSRLSSLLYLLYTINNIAHIVYKYFQHCSYQFATEFVIEIEYFQLNSLNVVKQFFRHVGLGVENRVTPCKKKERCKFSDVTYHFLKKIIRQKQTNSFCVRRHLIVAHNLPFAND